MKKQKSLKGAAAATDLTENVTDPRFASFITDPRFRLPSKKHRRTKIDKRFSSMLKDDDFTNIARVDRYGRKLSNTGKKQALQRLYQAEEDDEDEIGEEKEGGIEVEDDEIVARELRKADAAYDPARGGGFSSSDDDEEHDEGGGAVEEVAKFPDMNVEQAGVPMGEVSSRIAVVNLDWDNIRAVDLMAVFSSFVPAGGRIQKISVYKSEFGKGRMEREEIEGPPAEIFSQKVPVKQEEEEVGSEDEVDSEEESGDEELDEKIKKDLLREDDGQEFDSTALRQYQLERLRYYYAVIICSDKETANHIYAATDGTEYLSSANFFDLRFIPDNVGFDEKPRDECDSVPAGYRPTDFVTDALQSSKVKLTWDAEDRERKDVIKRAFSGSRAEIGENDLKAYLGSDSSEDEHATDENTRDGPKLSKKELARQKMRAALGLSDEPTTSSKVNRPVGDMEITFTTGLSSKEKGNIFENEPIKEETTAEAYIRKEKERKARRKEKAKALREGRDPAAVNNDKTDSKANASEPQEADLGFEDPFFNIDEDAKRKASKNLRQEERRKKREAKAAEAEANASNRAQLELLMVDNSTDTAINRLDHFDINEIVRTEKMKKKRQRSKRLSNEKEGNIKGGKRGGLQEGFEMDVQDPRFKAVFESHEFAIDPSNPKFKGTEGMKKLLEEGRRKRKNEGVDEGVVVAVEQNNRRKSDKTPKQKDDLRGLVENLKKKAKR